MSRKKMAGKDKETIAKETAEEAKAKKAAAEAAAKEAATLEAAAKEATKEAATKEAAAKEASKEAAAKEAAAKQAAKEAATKEVAAKEATKAATNKDAAAKKAAKEATSKEAAAKDAATRAAAAKEAAEKEAAAKEAAQWRGHHYWEWHHCVQCSFPLYPMSSYKSQKLLTAWVFFALASLEVVGAVGVTNDWFITVIPGGSQKICKTPCLAHISRINWTQYLSSVFTKFIFDFDCLRKSRSTGKLLYGIHEWLLSTSTFMYLYWNTELSEMGQQFFTTFKRTSTGSGKPTRTMGRYGCFSLPMCSGDIYIFSFDVVGNSWAHKQNLRLDLEIRGRWLVLTTLICKLSIHDECNSSYNFDMT